MKEHGILFKPSMITAIKENRKTQTRRIIHPQLDCEQISEEEKIKLIKKARYQLDDKLYIKEPFAIDHVWGNKTEDNPTKDVVSYKFGSINRSDRKWTSPLFMPKKLARTWMIVKAVRVERVQDISEHDCIREGVDPNCLVAKWNGETYYVPEDAKCNQNVVCQECGLLEWINYLGDDDGEPCYSAKDSFASLWDSINAKPKGRLVNGKIASYTSYPWEEDPDRPDTYRGKEWISYPNPWVYVYEFEAIK